MGTEVVLSFFNGENSVKNKENMSTLKRINSFRDGKYINLTNFVFGGKYISQCFSVMIIVNQKSD